jgi:hypothetical protein
MMDKIYVTLTGMKTNIFWKLVCGLTLATLPLLGGCDQEVANSAPSVAAPSTDQQEVSTTITSITNGVSPDDAEQKLESAPGEVVSTPTTTPSNVKLSTPASEIVRLAQAGVDESVMMTYVTSSPNTFNLGADDIIYLNDVGVPGTVVTAMLQHDQTTRAAAPNIASTPVNTTPSPGAPAPYPTTDPTATEPPPVTAEPPPENVSYTYFYNSLAPYGNWVDIAGYGRCWQPTVVVANPGWQPYCDGGHWVYSDCGWYWASSYTWGWAPFHYGRWFRHGRFGWCWAPDTCWGPSWVSWRYSPGYCGWAPLPPTACFAPGVGFTFCGSSVGFGFSFGLTASHFVFVSTGNFCDPHPVHHRLSAREVNVVFNKTVVNNQIIVASHNRIINHGIPVDQVRTASHREIHPVRIEATDNFARAHVGGGNQDGHGTLTAFRPALPQPARGTLLVGEGVKPAPQQNSSHRSERNSTAVSNPNSDNSNPRNRVAPVKTEPVNNSAAGYSTQRTGEIPPIVKNESPAPSRNESRLTAPAQIPPATAAKAERPAPLIYRGPNRPGNENNTQQAVNSSSSPLRGQNDGGRARLLTPVTENSVSQAATSSRAESVAPMQNNSPVQNNSVYQNQRPFTTPNQPMRRSSSNPNQGDRKRNNDGASLWDTPRQYQPDRQTTLGATGPVERRQAAQSLQIPRMVQPQESSGFNPSFQRPAPSQGPQMSAPAATRMGGQMPTQSAPSQRGESGSGRGDKSRGN